MVRPRGTIRINGMEFFAYHGLYDAEKAHGGNFRADLSFTAETAAAAASDAIGDAVDYTEIYRLIAEEMNIPSQLLEHLVSRVLTKIMEKFPGVQDAELTVHKLNPPMDGSMESVSVTLSANR